MAGDLGDLALFVEVIDSGSITAGALRRNLSLPAASTRISALERWHGVELLHRSRRGVSPTAAGEVLAEHARRVLAEARELEQRMAAHSRGLRHEIRLASNSSAVDTLTEFLAAALARFPDTTVVLTETSSNAALGQVAAGTADIAVVSATPQRDRYQTRELWDDRLVVIGAPTPGTNSDDGGNASGPHLEEVLRSPLIGLTEGNPLQTLIESQASRLDLVPSYRVRLPSLAAVCAVASTGAGPAIVPSGTARRLGIPASGTLPLNEPWAQRQALLVAREFDALSQPAADFAEALMRYRLEITE
ncbi:LysR family transcriptional regulator [Arthrobacter sp. USHLN218]|uniref:LysR family transcriptional regulator n=1 Tax=Arthrobacter sp. USHLN218 TaxID=3081232 RepID=UPI00301AFF5D